MNLRRRGKEPPGQKILDGGVVSRTTGAYQIGGGIDIKTPIPALGFRVQTRHFLTGDPGFGFRNHQTVSAGAGIVLRF